MEASMISIQAELQAVGLLEPRPLHIIPTEIAPIFGARERNDINLARLGMSINVQMASLWAIQMGSLARRWA